MSCAGDGMIPIGEIRKMARHLGVEDAGHLGKDELIRAIQVREGHQPCFGSQWCNPCQWERCLWKADCNAQPFGN